MLLGAGLLAAAGCLVVHLIVSEQRTEVQSALAHFDSNAATVRRAPVSPDEALRLQEEQAFVRHTAQQLGLPWGALFDAVEAPDYQAVTLLGVVPNVERKEVQIEAEARDLADILPFVRQLREAGGLHGARLLGHETVRRDSAQAVRFKVVGTWGG
ncbi:MAG: hypothetical protein KIS79_05775 [Burkholderiales bacterium]|nr:hypothetical protein [Burkholderiales bacterium]